MSPSAADTGSYAIRPIPITDVEAFRKHTPPIGSHHLVIVLRDGSVHPPLHFFNGGIKALMAVLREHVHLVKSASDSQTYLVAGDAGDAAPLAVAGDTQDPTYLSGAQAAAASGPGEAPRAAASECAAPRAVPAPRTRVNPPIVLRTRRSPCPGGCGA